MNTNRLLLSIALVHLAGQVRGADPLPEWEPTVKTVAAFKNGLGFVHRSGPAQLAGGWAVTGPLPTAALGGLWIGTADTNQTVTEVIVSVRTNSTERPATTISDLLAANIRRRVSLTYQVGQESRTAMGTVLSVPTTPTLEAGLALRVPFSNPGREVDPHPDLVLLRTESNPPMILSIRKSAIVMVEFPQGSRLERRDTVASPFARLRVSGNSPRAELTMTSLEKGITWSPAYRLELRGERRTRIILEAVLVNDVADLEEAEVAFVVGYPNFLYADLLSPLSLQQSVAEFILALRGFRPGQDNSGAGNILTQNVMLNSLSPATGSGGNYSASPPMAGETSEDLFFYKKPGVTMKKGDRARFTVLEAEIPSEHIYLWHVTDSMNIDDRGYRRGEVQEAEQHVWHALELENITGQPWTTAPAFAMRDSLPLAQDVLNYTPPGTKTKMRLTVSTDVHAEQSQIELERTSVTLGTRTLDKVTVEGQMRVRNLKTEAIRLAVSRSLVGEVVEAAEGKVTKVAVKLTSVNPASEIEWAFSLPAKEEKLLRYRHTVFVSR